MVPRIDSRRPALRAVATVVLTGLLAASAASAAHAAETPPGGGAVEDLISLPNGFQPEGITIDPRGTAYLGSLADGDIYAADLRTGEGEIISEGTGAPSVGLKIDRFGRLFVAGGPSGTARVIDATSGDVLATYQLAPAPAFINDVVLTGDGAWFTNSQAAELYFLPVGPSGTLADADDIVTLPLTGAWVQQPGFNANGIAQTTDRKALLVIQSSTSTLYRVDPSTGVTTAVDLDGAALPFGDGLLLVGKTLYVVQNRLNQVAVVRMDADGRSGSVVETLSSESFDVPTTVAAYGSSLFLPNARFGTPPTPATEYDVVRIDR
jgi:streptogramin lyase